MINRDVQFKLSLDNLNMMSLTQKLATMDINQLELAEGKVYGDQELMQYIITNLAIDSIDQTEENSEIAMNLLFNNSWQKLIVNIPMNISDKPSKIYNIFS